MDYQVLLDNLVKFVILPIIPLLGVYGTLYLQKQIDKIKMQTNSERVSHYIDKAERLIVASVSATQQVFVDNLKKEGLFTPERQREAFVQAKSRVMVLLHEESVKAIEDIYGDYNAWIDMKLEEVINARK